MTPTPSPTMAAKLIFTGLLALLAGGPALAQSANLTDWAAAGDVSAVSASAATLTTAAVDSGETPLSAPGALLHHALEPALGLAAGTLAADTLEGSGLQHSFNTPAGGTRVHFDWTLRTVNFDADFADRAWVVVDGGTLLPLDGGTLLPLGTVAAALVGGSFNITFADAAPHSLVIALLDVGDVLGLSTLVVSNFSVSAVPEPTHLALLLAGLLGLGAVARRRGR